MAHSNKLSTTIHSAFSFRQRRNSIFHALKGLWIIIRHEPNAIIHSLGMVIVLIGAYARELNKTEWCLLSIAVGMVWVAEAFNTAIEKLCNLYSQSFHPLIKTIKDVSAAAVLLTSLCSLSIGIIIFLF